VRKDTTTNLTEPQVSPNGEKPAETKYDPFDPKNLHMGAMADIEVEKVLTMVPVRKPDRREFVRVHRDPGYTVDTLLLERQDGIDKEWFVVAPSIQHLVLPELRRVRLYTAITRRGVVFLWPVKLPLEDTDRLRRVSETAMQAAEEAKSLWVRVPWNRDLGGYELHRAKGDLGEPQWPDKSFRDLLEIAFRHNVIDRLDHPVIKELEGEL
jgi:hypothetical protein